MEWKYLKLGQGSCRCEISGRGSVRRPVANIGMCQDYKKISTTDKE